MYKCQWCGKELNRSSISSYCSNKCSAEHTEYQAKRNEGSGYCGGYALMALVFLIVLGWCINFVGSCFGKTNNTSPSLKAAPSNKKPNN